MFSQDQIDLLFARHLESFDGMTDLLEHSYDWAELSCSTSDEFLTDALDALLQGAEVKQNFLDDYLDRNIFIPPQDGSCLQFFFDLFGFGSSIDSNDILVSYLNDVDTFGSQRYEVYFGDSPADIQFFFESIVRQPALIFQGTFAQQYTKGDPSPSTRARLQRSLNAVCVDIDSLPNSDGFHDSISPETLDQFLSLCPIDLLPSYICLTGNGIHLWYVFNSPIQVFSRNTIRTRKLSALSRGLYRCVELFAEGLDLQLDTSCCALNHGFRAPGSLTKYGDQVRCFCPRENLYKKSSVNASELSKIVAGYLGDEFDEKDLLLESDAIWKSRKQITEEHDAWIKSRMETPASEAQLITLADLESQGLLRKAEVESLKDINLLSASELIRKAVARRADAKAASTTSNYSTWRVKPHSLIAGSTGGVYTTVLRCITEVKVGRRYNSLHMLAGVAYMMIRPSIPKEEVHKDFMALLNTSWAQAGTPLTERDIKNALAGYNPNNRQTVNSIISTLGFSPFKEPAKRNGRTQEEHLNMVARKKIEKSKKKITQILREQPDISISKAARLTGLSRPTVTKYWEECKRDMLL